MSPDAIEPKADRKPQRRKLGLLGALVALGAAAVVFYRRQNRPEQLGGPMSLAKILWLNYALAAWYLVPWWFLRSGKLSWGVRRAYAAHLASFAARGAAELWMLYVTVSWKPPYGIGHDLFTLGLITTQLRGDRERDATARPFLNSIRVALVVEVLFAWLFYRASQRESGIYFASNDPTYQRINRLTWVAVVAAYTDLGLTLWRERDALFPLATETVDAG